MLRREFIRNLLLTATAPPLVNMCGAAETIRATPKLGTSKFQTYKQPPKCWRQPKTRLGFGGTIESYLTNITERWLKVATLSNPAMLEMFRDRDRKPYRDLLPWSGEFAGKYLTSAVQVLRCRDDKSLRIFVARFVDELIAAQAEDGYLGPWPKESRLTGRAPNMGKSGGDTWDAWGHYHAMIGLLLWHEESGELAALRAAQRIGDLFCTKFEKARLVDTGSTEMNLAPIHSLCRLYRETNESRYLRLAEKIRDEFAATNSKGAPLAGDYLNAALAGREFFQMPKPRWESLHPIMGLAELYWITGENRYRQAFEQIWWSIVNLDRHNNGGFSSGEQAQGNPYHQGAIETCCTIAWMALSVEMLRMTRNSIVADELELSTLNSVIGLHSPSGRWVTYNTPMDGVRKASAHDIVFQARPGSPELNCCSVNGARGFGLLSEWALMSDEKGLILNWYGPSVMETQVEGQGNGRAISVKIRQETEYPRSGSVKLVIEPERAAEFRLALRIPHWSTKTRVTLNGRGIDNVQPATYLELDRRWKRGDTLELVLDFRPHFWAGERECAGKVSIYRGPILLTYDRRFNDMEPDAVPTLDAMNLLGAQTDLLSPTLSSKGGEGEPMLHLHVKASDGRTVRLCDFGSAGSRGTPYRSWLPITNVNTTAFSRENPLRSGRETKPSG